MTNARLLEVLNTVFIFYTSVCSSSILEITALQPQLTGGRSGTATPGGEASTVGRWLKDRKEKNKETRAHNAQLHAAVSVARWQQQ